MSDLNKPLKRHEFSIKKIFNLFFKNILIILLLSFVLWMSFFDENSLVKHFEIKDRIKKQKKEIKNYIEENERFESIINTHETDTMNEEFEKIIREEYNLAKPNEIIFKIEK